ncbi:hypothetical protein [Bradyrhizobium liaoningense]
MIKKISLFELFRSAVMRDPKASRKDAFEGFLESVQDNPAAIKVMAEEYFYRQYAQWKPEKVGKSYSLVATPATERRVETSIVKRQENAQRFAKKKDEVKERIIRVILLDLTLPTGKKLRDATGAECAKAGGFYTEIARHLKPSQVVDKHMNERDLQELWTRYNGEKRRGGGAELHA